VDVIETQRFLLTIHYDGSGFHGWQVQPGVRTVQGEIEGIVERISGAHRTVLASGRTDTGVHATGQMATVDLPASWTAPRLRRALNGLLDDDVWIQEIRSVPDRFHPRYDAVARTYRYQVGLSPLAESPFHRRWCWPLREAVDLPLMEETGRTLVGDHSFRAFAKSGQEERGDRCTVESVAWEPWHELGLSFSITANRYLHHMVRYLVGTLVAVGTGKRPAGDVARLLDDSGDGLTTSPPAPPEGLFLARVEYPAHAFTLQTTPTA